jgi:ribonuclease J
VRPSGDDLEKPVESESEVEAALVETLRSRDGLAVVLGSAQNVDRLVTVYRAALRADRTLVIDPYTADVARATGNPNIPKPGLAWPRIRVRIPQRQRVRIKQAGEFERASAVEDVRIFDEELAASPGSFVLCGAFSGDVSRLIRTGALDADGVVVWSLWDGYLAERSGARLQTSLAAASVPMVHHHTSGHASAEDLARLAAAIAAHRVVPIHTEHPGSYPTKAIAPEQDGAWWLVRKAHAESDPGSSV